MKKYNFLPEGFLERSLKVSAHNFVKVALILFVGGVTSSFAIIEKTDVKDLASQGVKDLASKGSEEDKENKVSCRLVTNDVGTIIGSGKNKIQAQSDAAEKCFEKREALFRASRQTDPTEDRSLDFIDSCVNLRCS